MRPSPGIIACSMLLLVAHSGGAWGGDYLLYAPQPTESDKLTAGPEEGILVKGITIKRGDTLKALARKYRGKSSYFPQILLFNKISNPDLIHAGVRLLMPITEDGATSLHKSRKVATPAPNDVEVPKTDLPASSVTTHPAVKQEPDAGQQLFQKAARAYKKGDYRQALKAFDRFLSKFSNSPLAADASLYRADCLLNLSRQ
ncbi:tetratricopeptide repeat protein [Geotalea uraniireducens]|uniref:Peptidoglycan-binding LysM n=1 Tax=Geotalea uraniireducens (strain Rf4) TaxID=351605 RepID=A5GCX0_GEOUR|nr:tetratricopeptide repeat protein [Geotalea uraniireducens]ABQ24583.1 Peptidoglycan-binding LysM [Geotalea uraniireducens Rf4]